MLQACTGSCLTSNQEIIPASNTFNKLFLDLLRRIFLYDPKARITAKAALKHPWFREGIMDDGSEAARLRRERELGRAPTSVREL